MGNVIERYKKIKDDEVKNKKKELLEKRDREFLHGIM